MQTRSRSQIAIKKQLLQQVTQAHEKIVDKTPESTRRTRSSTPKQVKQKRLRPETKKKGPQVVEKEVSMVKGKFFLGSTSLEDDKKLYKEARNNPAVLAFLKEKLKHSLIYVSKLL